ncbi:MAG: anion permease, partial [Clostridia bacterium]
TGQILAMLVTGTIVTPMLPSVNAKAVLMAPLAHEVSKSAGFEKSSAGAGGLFSAAYMPACVFGNAFLTGSLFVALLIGFVPAEEVSHWDFMNILSCTFVWFIIVAVLTFFAIMLLYKPKETIQFEKGYAKAQLKEMGKITRDEIVCGICLIFAIVLWVDPFGLKIDPTVVGLCAFTAICLFGGQAFTVADFGTRIPWRMVILIGGIQAIAGMLSAHKISTWISATIGPIVAPLISNAFVMVLLVIVVVYLLRYVVISQVATATIAFAIFGGLAAVAGINSFFILGFVIYVSGQIWTTPFNNTAEMAARAITNDEMVEHKDTVKMSYAYMVINIIALCASVPLWMALGYIA